MKKMMETIAITFLGGMLFTLLHVPLSWMLGPMSAVLLWTSVTRRRLVWPMWLRNGGLILLGYSMGLSFTLESAKQIYTQLPYMFVATLLTVVFSILTAFPTSRQAGVSLASGVIGSIPGGLSQMVVLSDEIEGADAAVVAFMQTLRLLLVVFVIPFTAVHGLAQGIVGGGAGNPVRGTTDMWGSLLGWAEALASRPPVSFLLVAGVAGACWIAAKLRFPTPYFLGPIIAAAAFTVFGTEPPRLPSLFVLMAQWSLGIYIGVGIKLSSLKNWRRLLPYTVVGNIALIGFTLGLSYVFSLALPMSMLTAFLGMSPGGMAEMSVTAALVGADVSLVVAYQLFRILFILLIVPYMLRWGFKYFKRKADVTQGHM